MRLFELRRYRINSDEPQHLHIAWCWTQHLLPYRDVFDNHMPLFQLLSAPFVALVGEHAMTLIAMRLLMVPLYFLIAWCTYRLGAVAFSPRVGVWAAVLLSAFPPFFFCSLQYRTDNLWTALWLLCLVVLARARFTKTRALTSGLLLGLCFAVSMKSILFALSLGYAALVAGVFFKPRLRMNLRRIGLRLGIFVLASGAIPALIAGAFASAGLWPQFYYDVIGHNLLPSREPMSVMLVRHGLYVLALAAVLLVAARARSAARTIRWRIIPAWIALLWGGYLFSLLSLWRMLTPQDYLPIYPLGAVFVAAATLEMAKFLQRKSAAVAAQKERPFVVPALLCACGMLLSLRVSNFGANGTRPELSLLRNVLQLTGPADFVIDAKGETVFRQRAPFFVYESVTNARIRAGLLVDDLAARATAAHACFVSTLLEERLSPGALSFVERNYLPVNHNVSVAGCRIPSSGGGQNGGYFETVIPAAYDVVAVDPPLSGELDGKHYDGAIFLQPGLHRFVAAQPHKALALIWDPARRAHFDPFRLMPHPATR